MDDNMILSDAIEQLIVEDLATGEQFAVITHQDVFTASDNIVVRLKPRTSNDPPPEEPEQPEDFEEDLSLDLNLAVKQGMIQEAIEEAVEESIQEIVQEIIRKIT